MSTKTPVNRPDSRGFFVAVSHVRIIQWGHSQVGEITLRGGLVMSKQWKPGDKVRLHNGAPEMKVQGESHIDGHYICVWFAGGQPHEKSFHGDTLEAVEEIPVDAPAVF